MGWLGGTVGSDIKGCASGVGGRGACKPAIQSEGSKCWIGGQSALHSDLYPHLGSLHTSKPSFHRLVSSDYGNLPWSPQRCLAQKRAQKSPLWPCGCAESSWKKPHLKNRRISQTLTMSDTDRAHIGKKWLSFHWQISGGCYQNRCMHWEFQPHFPVAKSVLKQGVFQLATVKQPERNVVCTWIEFQSTTYNFPLETQLSPTPCLSNLSSP